MIHSCVFTDELSPDFEETIRLCAELRVEYIEPRGGLFGTNVNKIDMEGAQAMKKIMDQYGVKVGCIGSGFGKCSLFDEEEWEEHLQIFDRQVAFADLWDVNVIRIFPFWVPEDVDWRGREERPDLDDYLDQIVEKLRGPCERAEKEGLYLCLEPEGSTFSGTLPEIRKIIDAVGSDALNVAWDVSNSWSYGRVAWPDDYPLIKGRVKHLHIKDATFDPNDPTVKTGRTHIDLGEIPWEEIFRVLIADGYDGMASVETHLFFGMADKFRWLQPATINALRNLNRILAKVQGQI
jgi:sugar phosphate isomerase/epimerase